MEIKKEDMLRYLQGMMDDFMKEKARFGAGDRVVEEKLDAMIQNDVNVIISEGMGAGIVNKIEEEGLSIEVYAGVKGKADDAIIKYLSGMLDRESVLLHG